MTWLGQPALAEPGTGTLLLAEQAQGPVPLFGSVSAVADPAGIEPDAKPSAGPSGPLDCLAVLQ